MKSSPSEHHRCTHKTLIGNYTILSTRRNRSSHELRAVGTCRGCGRWLKWWSRWDTNEGWRERVIRIDETEYNQLLEKHDQN
jgi:hypothetical protein